MATLRPRELPRLRFAPAAWRRKKEQGKWESGKTGEGGEVWERMNWSGRVICCDMYGLAMYQLTHLIFCMRNCLPIFCLTHPYYFFTQLLVCLFTWLPKTYILTSSLTYLLLPYLFYLLTFLPRYIPSSISTYSLISLITNLPTYVRAVVWYPLTYCPACQDVAFCLMQHAHTHLLAYYTDLGSMRMFENSAVAKLDTNM